MEFKIDSKSKAPTIKKKKLRAEKISPTQVSTSGIFGYIAALIMTIIALTISIVAGDYIVSAFFTLWTGYIVTHLIRAYASKKVRF